MGHSVLDGGPTGIGLAEHWGLRRQPVGDGATAERIYEAHLRSGQFSPSGRRELIVSLLRQHRFEQAAHEAEVSDHLDLLALARLRSLERAGQMTRRDLKAVSELLQTHLCRQPHDSPARDRLARLSLAVLDFEAARIAVGESQPPRLTLDFVDWTRSTVGGDHVAAYRAKRTTARGYARRRARRTGTVGDMVLRIQAINFVDGPGAALAELDRRWLFAATGMERLIREKVRADLELLRGDPEPLRGLARESLVHHESSERGFRSMVADKRVLVVGPSPSSRPDPSLIAEHDAVATTARGLAPDGHGRDSIVYLSNEAYHMESDAEPDADDRVERLVVLRPSAVNRFDPRSIEHPRVRVQPFEDSSPLFGTHFALQRIIYDLLAHGASAVTISGIDFFLGEQVYVEGYDAQASNRFAEIGYNFSHDFAYGFWYTKALWDRGLVHASPGIECLLDLPVESYLARLGRVFV